MTLVIGIITTIITLLIIALEIMIGYERGIRRNLIRTVMLIGVAVLTMYITSPIVEFIVRKLVVTNKLNDYLFGLTGVNPGEFFIFQESAVNLFTIFLNPFVYVILFWILKLVTFGIYLLIDRYIINKKLTKLFPSPTKKSCIGGAVLGGAYAILIGAIFFMPISAYSDLLQKTEAETIAAGQTGGVSELFGANRYRMAVGYHNTPSYYFYKYTGTKLLGDTMFSSLTKRDVTVATISIDQTLPSIVKVYYASKVLRSGITQNSSPEEYTDYYNSLNIVVEEYSKNDLIIGTEEEKITLVNDLMKQGEVFADNDMVKAILSNVDYTSLTAFQQDIKTLTGLSSLLTEKGIISDLLKDSSDIIPKEFISRLDDATIVGIADQLYSLDQAETVVPILAEKFLGLMLGETDLGVPSLVKLTDFADTKKEFVEIFDSGKQLADLIEKGMTMDKAEQRTLLEENMATLEASDLISQDALQRLRTIINTRINLESN